MEKSKELKALLTELENIEKSIADIDADEKIDGVEIAGVVMGRTLAKQMLCMYAAKLNMRIVAIVRQKL